MAGNVNVTRRLVLAGGAAALSTVLSSPAGAADKKSRGAGLPTCVLSQLGMSVSDLLVTTWWHQNVIGLKIAGGGLVGGDAAGRIIGVVGAQYDVVGFVDQQDHLEYEVEMARNPPARRRARDWSPSDAGIAMVGMHVDDFDGALARATAAGSAPLSPPIGSRGTRRVCVPDPDGKIIELMEDDPRAAKKRARPNQSGAALRFITLVAPDLDLEANFFRQAYDLKDAPEVALHGPEHYALWGLPNAKRRSVQLWAGDILLELVTYLDPKTRPWPKDYKLTDIGWNHFAFFFDTRDALDAAFARAVKAGAKPNEPKIDMYGTAAVMYSKSPQGFSVETTFVDLSAYLKTLSRDTAQPESPNRNLVVEQTFSLPWPKADVWRRLVADDPVLSYKLAETSRPFDVADRNAPIIAGSTIEFSREREWWLEKIISVVPGSSIALKNLSNNVITDCRLSDGPSSSTVVSLKQYALPHFTDADKVTRAELQKSADALAGEIKALLI